MSTKTLVSLEEYLASSYEPDCDYVDGRVEERNLGETAHATLQLRIGAYLLVHYRHLGLVVGTGWRTRVSAERVRVPDVCLVLHKPNEPVLTKPPFLCIEILSPEDRMGRLKVRIDDYLKMGVPNVWVIDPETKEAYIATPAEGFRELKTGVLRTENPSLEVPLSELFD